MKNETKLSAVRFVAARDGGGLSSDLTTDCFHVSVAVLLLLSFIAL